jgi:glycosyltransferase involved in cell wall biosynthesis
MKETSSVSVIIPSFNRPQLTLRAVKSVLAQTWTRFEVLVIDDGSRSDQIFPSELVDDERVRMVRHPVNLGVSAARNTGVKECRFPLIAFLDSDDRWLPEKLSNQIAVYEKHCVQENILVFSSYYGEQGNMRTIYPLSPWKRDQPLSEFIFLSCGSLATCTWLTSRALLQQFPFDVHLSQCEDYDLLLRMQTAGVEFVWCKTPDTIVHCDLREDRLSSQLHTKCYAKFLEQNRERLTPMSYVVLESIILNATYKVSLRSRLQNHLCRFLTSPRLHWLARLRLVLIYIIRRCAAKIRLLVNLRPVQNTPL